MFNLLATTNPYDGFGTDDAGNILLGDGSVITGTPLGSTPPYVPGRTSSGAPNSGGVLGAIASLANTGLNAYNTVRQSDLISQQIKAGQIPSIVQDTTGRPSGAIAPNVVSRLNLSSAGSTSWLVVGALVLLLVLVFKK